MGLYSPHTSPNQTTRRCLAASLLMLLVTFMAPRVHGQFAGRWTQPVPTPPPAPIAGTDNTLIQDVQADKPLYASQYNAIINATNAFLDGWMLSGSAFDHATYNGIITHNRTLMSGGTFTITGTLQIDDKLTTKNRLFGASQTAAPHVWHTAGITHIISGALADLTGNPILIHNHLAQKLAGGGTDTAAIIGALKLCGLIPCGVVWIDIDNAVAATGGHLSTSPRHFRTDRGFATDHPDIVIASGDDTSIGIDNALQMVDFASGSVSHRLQTNPCNNTGSLTLSYPYGTNPDGSFRCRAFPNAPTPTTSP